MKGKYADLFFFNLHDESQFGTGFLIKYKNNKLHIRIQVLISKNLNTRPEASYKIIDNNKCPHPH